MLSLRPILQVIGILLLPLGLGMLVPALVDIALGHPDWQVFVVSSFFTLFVGFSLFLSTRGAAEALSVRQAFLLTVLAWAILPAFAGLPLAFSGTALSYTDAYFEAMSGLTTTGATVLTGLDTAPPGILLWRGILQWLGGVGIIVMAIAVLPMLRVGGMQLFRTESSETSEKILPRVTQIAGAIVIVYVILSTLCFLSLWLAGMPAFDALAHAMSTISTAGFSTKDASLGFFDSAAIDFVEIVFMILGALPFLLYVQIIRGGTLQLWRDDQVRAFLGLVAGAVAVMTAWLWLAQGFGFFPALRYGAFNVVSIITTTGFTTAPFDGWGNFAVVVFFVLIFLGGCAGSSSGGLKTYRLRILFSLLVINLKRLTQPHAVYRPMFNDRPVPDSVTASVMAFLLLYFVSFFVLSFAVALTGPDFITSVSGVMTALSNTGPGLGPVIGPAGNFQSLPDAAKGILAFAMMLGRLELMSVLVLLTPGFWRA